MPIITTATTAGMIALFLYSFARSSTASANRAATTPMMKKIMFPLFRSFVYVRAEVRLNLIVAGTATIHHISCHYLGSLPNSAD